MSKGWGDDLAVRLRDEQGMMAIGVALMLTIVLALFGGALWHYSMAELRRLERTEQDLQALFLARAGAEAVMGMWLDPEQTRPDLPVSLDPIYYASDAGFFSSASVPEDYLGTVQVTIRREEYSEDEEKQVTVIESMATVGSTTRTARLMTYPHRYGHDLAWYSGDTGRIYPPTAPVTSAPSELIVMRANSPGTSIFVGSGTVTYDSPRTIPFEAGHLVFENPLNLPLNGNNLRDGPSGKVDVALTAEVIFLHGLELAYLPETLTNPMKSYSIVLDVPDGRGQYGSEIQDNIADGIVTPGALYGEIYFDSSPASLKEFYWWAIFGFGSVYLRTTHPLDLQNQAYYFRKGTRLDAEAIYAHVNGGRSIGSYFDQMADAGLLVPIRGDKQLDRESLESIQPFFWDQ